MKKVKRRLSRHMPRQSKRKRGARAVKAHRIASISGRARRSKPVSKKLVEPAEAKTKIEPVISDRPASSTDIPTLEQVSVTCSNCGKVFKVLKLKGLSMQGIICQRCSLGEMELPDSFG